ncbi:uncharacterized protein I303_106772 [Kwoniella dejecticola CBS 10117]|uniref:Glucosamine 6-phosphate N-acetyltransferase n=1 Tax=Kwoniella dejecticola CBS 10117 TaxID=1296121 RepID=A0A1A5ZTR4_9TREE|nr:glucosamine-phosphate N-acetyltransferase [Kwoniella dejecticola CBS 10117]OBR81201.1 glucosamine-phosphate N-acetyltransferase [Kwoniella dejecticola CBS 10117]
MTSDHQLDLLFDPSLIPASVQNLLGPELHLRPLASDDVNRGHFDVLSVLTVAPQLSPKAYKENFDRLKACAGTYFIIVIVDKATDKIVASGSIIVERKFLRNAGLVGHIEDIAVSKAVQGKKLGLRIINALEEIGASQGCYKIILDCSEKNIPFYEKCGFKHKEFEMVRYMADPKDVAKSPTTSKL